MNNNNGKEYYQPTVDFLNYAYSQINASRIRLYPSVYTTKSFFNTVFDKECCELDKSSVISDSFLWVADWTTSNHPKTEPALPDCWNEWYLWQYTDTGNISAVTGKSDIDCFPLLENLENNNQRSMALP